ncbi:MAG: heme-binding protein [Euryarchaeota archaeon]|nr:heme-binding protein [Euryarchaeota archaeon]
MVETLEEPRYQLISDYEDFEIRLYSEVIQAQVSREIGENFTPSNNFRTIAGYIFGNNESNEKIAMTSPVEMWDNKSTMNMAFTMPSEYSFTNLPEPNDSKVKIVKVPERLVAVKRFSGFYGSKKVSKIVRKLNKSLIERSFKPYGSYILAVYDPPTRLPFLRRNEILIPIKEISYSEEIVSGELL